MQYFLIIRVIDWFLICNFVLLLGIGVYVEFAKSIVPRLPDFRRISMNLDFLKRKSRRTSIITHLCSFKKPIFECHIHYLAVFLLLIWIILIFLPNNYLFFRSSLKKKSKKTCLMVQFNLFIFYNYHIIKLRLKINEI